jgi:DNA-binding MarR family transcriptional regulator
VQNAVYAHIRAIRALGRTKINTAEVADALLLSVGEVNRAISSLKGKGVKVLNG